MTGTLIVGDIHGEWARINKLINKKRPYRILQVGDLGWWPKMEIKSKSVLYHIKQEWSLKGIKCKGTDVRWCDGNHEDHEDLRNKSPGGYSTWLYDDVVYQPRGSVYTLPDGRIVLFFGGASSVDKNLRIPGHDWFADEIPNFLDYQRAIAHQKVDIVISHTCPNHWLPTVWKRDKEEDTTREMLDAIWEKYRPELWYHGHWHVAKEGTYEGTKWHCLDYPGHGGKWWDWLPKGGRDVHKG